MLRDIFTLRLMIQNHQYGLFQVYGIEQIHILSTFFFFFPVQTSDILIPKMHFFSKESHFFSKKLKEKSAILFLNCSAITFFFYPPPLEFRGCPLLSILGTKLKNCHILKAKLLNFVKCYNIKIEHFFNL